MALTVFSSETGRVVATSDPAIPAKLTVKLDEWPGFPSIRALLTRVAISSAVNMQILHTIGNDAFIYTFGDRVGQMVVSGLALDSTCEGPFEDAGGKIALEEVMEFYSSHRVLKRQPPMKLTLGAGTTIQGYLTAFNSDVEDIPMRLWRFAMVFAVVPESTRKEAPVLADPGAGGGGGGGGGGSILPPGQNGDVVPGQEQPPPPLKIITYNYSEPASSPFQQLGSVVDQGGRVSAGAVTPVVALGYDASDTGPRTDLVKGFTLAP